MTCPGERGNRGRRQQYDVEIPHDGIEATQDARLFTMGPGPIGQRHAARKGDIGRDMLAKGLGRLVQRGTKG